MLTNKLKMIEDDLKLPSDLMITMMAMAKKEFINDSANQGYVPK